MFNRCFCAFAIICNTYFIFWIFLDIYILDTFNVGGSVCNSLGNIAFRGFWMQNPLGLWTFGFNKVNKPKGKCVLILQIASTPT